MRYYYTLILILFAVSTYAQTTFLTGRIMDAVDHLALPGATIKLLENNRYTVSNHNGQFEFLNLPAGSYTLSVEYIGFKPLLQPVVLAAGRDNYFSLQLSSATFTLDDAVVMGDMARGQAKALNQQKNNVNITNMVSSDQMGRFPDANIGDALKRVAGITMQNDQGEARNIIIRGMAPALNSVTLNGDRIPSAEGDNRNVQMDLIPSDMISTMEVNKTLTPDMDADAIGGSVNLITRASPNGQRLSATLAGGYMPIRDKGTYSAGLVYGNRFANNKIGLVWSGSLHNSRFGSDNIEGLWQQDDHGQLYMKEMDIRKYDVQRIRRSTALALDYKINDKHQLYTQLMYNWRDDRENRYRLRYRSMAPRYNEEGQLIGYSGSLSRQTKGGANTPDNKNTRLERQKVQNYALGGDHLLSTAVALDWSMNYALASEDRPQERYIEHRTKKIDLQQELANPRLPLIRTEMDLLDSYLLNSISENHDYTQEREFGAKLNVRIPMTVIADQKGRLRAGLRLRLKDKSRDNLFYDYKPLTDLATLDALPIQYFGGEGFQPGSSYAPGYFVDRHFLGNMDLSNGLHYGQELVPSEFLTKNYSAKEQIYAAYLRWDQDINARLSVITGARVEQTHIDYSGNYVLEEEELQGQVHHKNKYVNLLPNLTLKYTVNPSFLMRAAFTTAIARPNYYSLAPYVSVVAEDSEMSAGNPDLKAMYAYNVDLMAEKYHQSIGLFSAGLFYKKVNNFIYTFVDKHYSRDQFNQAFPTQQNPIPLGETWSFVQDRNGDKVDVYGFEIAFQRQLDFLPGPFLKGFAIYANYTFTKSKAQGISSEDGVERFNVTLPGTAPHLFNGSLSWENNRFSSRISLNYTADYLDALGATASDDVFYDKQFFLDANLSFKISPKLRLFAEANNLTNQALRYYQGVAARTSQLEYYQARYNLGLKFDL